MPEIAPFAAIRFDHTRTAGDISHLIAPPYDVLNQDDKDALLLKSDHALAHCGAGGGSRSRWMNRNGKASGSISTGA